MSVKMLVGRVVLGATVFLLVIGDTTSRSQLREEGASKDQQIEKDGIGDHRQGRMALHAEPLASKEKREQALRHSLAARRRQILASRSIGAKTQKPVVNGSKDSLDMLEAQETRHGVFVTVPMGDQIAEIVEDDEDMEITPSTMQIIEAPSKPIESTSTLVPELNNTVVSKKDINGPRNSSISSRIQKSTDDVSRRKNTVVMPESLYNHFRPVESNIPVEDMTQFLYFGQKIHPENTTSNNSVEVTSASPTSTNSRRRFNPKRFTTTLSTVPKLEVIMNEEMDIASEKSIIERNKILKMKNVYRNNGIYSRKPPVRPSDPTIVTNVILTNRNASDTDVDSSAHANHLVITDQGKGSSTHWANNTQHSTQIPWVEHQDNGTESEMTGSDIITTIYPGELMDDYQNDEPVKSEDKFGRSKKSEISRMDDEIEDITTRAPNYGEKTSTELNSVMSTSEPDELRRLTRLSTWLSVDQVTTELASTVRPGFNDPTNIPTTNSHQHSSLRIVVTEPMDNSRIYERMSLVNSSIPPQVTPPTPLTRALDNSTVLIATEPPVASVQQMHPYTYTITNVTRLLRNYTGPGPSEKTTAVTTVISEGEKEKKKGDDDDGAGLLPPLSGVVGIEAARASVGASGDPTAVQTTTPVDERTRKVPQHRNTSENNQMSSTVINSTTEIISTTRDIDLNGATVRWNYTSRGDNERESSGDRRFMRKSASAVLNQRISDDRDFKRRRGDTGTRRIKGLKSEERYTGYRSMDNKTTSDHEVSLHNKQVNIDAMGEHVEDQTTLSSFTNVDVPPESLNDKSDENIRDNDRLLVTTISSEPGDRLNGTMETSTESTIEASTLGSIGGTMRGPSTTAKPSVFPVTPVILNGLNKVTRDEPEEVLIDSDSRKNPEKPFGIDKELDPSEIQKMYRAQTTLKPESAMTTLPPQVTRPNNSTTSAPKMVTSKQGERSPEVRGRNLSDKTKDKDDVLPIMQLYNNSNILNDTMKNSVTLKIPADHPPTITIQQPQTTSTPTTEAATMKTTEDISKDGRPGSAQRVNKNRQEMNREVLETGKWMNGSISMNKTRARPMYYNPGPPEYSGYHPELNTSYFESGMIAESPRDPFNASEVITKRHDGDTLATQETVAVVSYILATLVVFPIAVGVGLILRRLIIRNRKVLEESDTSSEISCRKDALNLENGDFKTSIEKAITKLPRIQHLCHEGEKPLPPSSLESRWEFPRDKLRLQTVLGQGNFGQVWKAEADDLTGHQGTTRLVAVKTVKEGASAREKEDLVRELEIMQQLGNHPNVVTLLGCCTEEEPHYLILEYVMYGKLLAYLRDHRTRQDFYNFSEDSAALTSRDLTVFGYCVARGMEYLASKKIIHRDLAARNVLVDHNKLCKIADFGMSRFANKDGECIETRHGRNALPIRWMAPESLIYSLFTTKTDVWSFGILMWEIVTLGSTPYPDMAAREVMRNVQNGYRLQRPSHCRSELFRVIARCWHADPDRRPEFQTLRRDLAQLLEDNMNGHYVDLESFASECAD